MTDDQRELLEKARESLGAARLLLKGGYTDFAASRAYYTMFYAAEALLEGKGLAYSKHAGVISGFGQHFARTGRVAVEYHKYLREGQDLRHSGDYGPPHQVTTEMAQRTITRAEQFLAMADEYIGAANDASFS
ncbi:MAG: HEPN domain-containing protein [bacterium]